MRASLGIGGSRVDRAQAVTRMLTAVAPANGAIPLCDQTRSGTDREADAATPSMSRKPTPAKKSELERERYARNRPPRANSLLHFCFLSLSHDTGGL